MKEVAVLVLSALGAVAWNELREWLPWFARRMTLLAVAALPIEDQVRMREELLAEVAAVPGKISPFIFASSLCWGFWRPVLLVHVDAYVSRRLIRAADITLSSLLSFALAPLMLYFVFAIKATSPGPVFFLRSEVAGNNKTFRRLVFRTFFVDPGRLEVTSVGRFLRKTQLDRLPILFCVLRGDMSFVGPPLLKPDQKAHQFADLKPGLVWFSAGTHNNASKYGRSTIASLGHYVALLWKGVVDLLGPGNFHK